MRGLKGRRPAARHIRPARLSMFMLRGQCGVSTVELLVALPVLLLLLLAVIQFVLVFHARHSLDYALGEAARRGAVSHAEPEAIRWGLATGLAPWLYGASNWADRVEADAKALADVELGLRMGWISVTQRSPTLESFHDWAEPARDRFGEQIRGMDEIPNDNLDNRRLRMQPRSGMAGSRRGEPVGQRSGQTLADANLLRLEMDYGVRLSVPVVAPIVLRVLSGWHGCGPMAMGYIPGTPTACRFYKARDLAGRPAGRIPVKVVAMARMMSPARRSPWLQAAATSPPAASAGQGAKPAGRLSGSRSQGAGMADHAGEVPARGAGTEAESLPADEVALMDDPEDQDGTQAGGPDEDVAENGEDAADAGAPAGEATPEQRGQETAGGEAGSPAPSTARPAAAVQAGASSSGGTEQPRHPAVCNERQEAGAGSRARAGGGK